MNKNQAGYKIKNLEKIDENGKNFLKNEGMPVPSTELKGSWWFAYDSTDSLKGMAGVELYENIALLRSLLVDNSLRKSGLGSKLVWEVLGYLYNRGTESVYLLTETAENFFSRWGFETIDRKKAPEVIENTEEMKTMCSKSAKLMHLSLKHPPILIRKARINSYDANHLARIYNQGIEDRMATFETTLRDGKEREEWLRERENRYAVIIAETQEKILGWLALNPFSRREAYGFVAEISIYIERESRSTGIGSRLLRKGIKTAKENGFHKLVLTMFPENMAARNLYRNHGFVTVGVLHEQGKLDGTWRNTEMMELLLEKKE